ncbi:MAG: DUF3313 family protein [Phycisphaerales bacterium]
MRFLLPFLLVCALLAPLAGCQTPVVVPRTGFVPMDVPLTTAPGDATLATFVAPGFGAASYDQVVVDTVVLFPAATAQITPAQVKSLRTLLGQTLVDAFQGKAVAAPAAISSRTLVIHAAVTQLVPNEPILNIAPQTQFRKKGYGYASVEMFATLGEGGPVQAAFTSTVNTQRLSAEKWSSMGTADAAASMWANEMVKLVR